MEVFVVLARPSFYAAINWWVLFGQRLRWLSNIYNSGYNLKIFLFYSIFLKKKKILTGGTVKMTTSFIFAYLSAQRSVSCLGHTVLPIKKTFLEIFRAMTKKLKRRLVHINCLCHKDSLTTKTLLEWVYSAGFYFSCLCPCKQSLSVSTRVMSLDRQG